MEAVARDATGGPAVRATLTYAYALAGRGNEARQILANIPPESEPYERTEVALVLGERDAALAYLNAAVEQHSVWVEWLKVVPAMHPLRDDPKFKSILALAGLQ